MIDAVNWVLTIRTIMMLTVGGYLGLLHLGVASPWPSKRSRHRAGRKRPTWTDSPLYHALGLEALPAAAVSLRSPGPVGAASYLDLRKLTRFGRQMASNRTVQMVRTAAPPTEGIME